MNEIVNNQINNNKEKEKINRINEKDVIIAKCNNNFINSNNIKEKSLSTIKVDQNLSEIKNNINKSNWFL